MAAISKQAPVRTFGKTSRLGLLTLGFLASLAVLASSARANPAPPALTFTFPASPGTSLTPRIQGEAEGVITAAVGPRLIERSDGATTMASEPPGMVTIYANESNCSDSEAIAAEGSAAELEGAGIEVKVEPDSITTFYASLTKESGSSPCSRQGIKYRQVTTPPGPPTFSSINPASPANDNTPHLIGNGESESVVSIYTTADCSGQPVGVGSAATFAAEGIQVSVPDNSLTTFYARATLAETVSSPCSESSIEYQDVAPVEEEEEQGQGGSPGSGGTVRPPAPELHTDPSGLSNDSAVLVTGSAPDAMSVEIFENAACTGAPVTNGSAAQFASGLRVQVAVNTSTSFYGDSLGADGGRSTCSAPVVYREDSTPPHTRFTMAPGAVTHKRKAVFRFIDTTEDPFGVTFLCKVNRGKWRSCHTPLRLHHLHFRSYLVHVKGIDSVGNAEVRGASRRFRVVHRS